MFDAREKAILTAVCDTFVPMLDAEAGDDPALFRLKASDLCDSDRLPDIIDSVAYAPDRRMLKLFLALIEIGLFNGLTVGLALPFSLMTTAEREALLLAWGQSPFPMARKLFQSLKRLTLAVFYAVMVDEQPNPTWPSLGYSGPPGAMADCPRTLTPLRIDSAQTLYADALVIGSGAGGGVVASELSAAGFDVIVAEKGGYRAEADFHGAEYDSSEHMYERRALLTTADLSMNVLAGSTLGGGTTVNWTTSLRPPDYVLREWAEDYGFSGATSEAYQHSLEAVRQRIHVTTEESQANPLNQALEDGCKALGYAVDVIPRNVSGCDDCGFCGYGCRFGAKQSTLKTYLQDAQDHGARILVNAEVERILIEQGTAQGAEIRVQTPGGETISLTVRAKLVIVAAGAIHTPALLLRSGLSNAHVGANLHLHPTTLVASRFEQPIKGWEGAPQTRVSRHFANLDGQGYGVWMETAPMHPGLAASAFPWQSGRHHKRVMQRIAHFADIIVLTRDRYGGQVTVNEAGEPLLHYHLHPYDGKHLMRGLLEAIKVHAAAGAQEIYGPHQHLGPYTAGEDLDRFLSRVKAAGMARHAFALYSAHQMSSCRIGGSSAVGAVSPEGESYEVRNLFVADGSVLPNAPGVNPMLPIMATAHYLAQAMKARL